jgi:hypothetical protein
VARLDLVICKNALEVTRLDTSFPELQREAERLIRECAKLDRPKKQSSVTASGLCVSGNSVSKIYENLMASIAPITGAVLQKAPMKSLARVVEKLALTAGDKNWKPELLLEGFLVGSFPPPRLIG